MLFQTTTGNANLPGASIKHHVFIVTPGRTTDGKPVADIPLWIAVKDATSGVRQNGAPGKVPAGNGLRPEAGFWSTGTYDVRDGTILKLAFSQQGGSFGTRRVIANQFLRVRSGAAYQRLRAALPVNERSTLTVLATEGRFDLLSLEDARALGIHVPGNFAQFFDPAEIARAWTTQVIEAELNALPRAVAETVTNSKGEEVTVTTTKARRALDL